MVQKLISSCLESFKTSFFLFFQTFKNNKYIWEMAELNNANWPILIFLFDVKVKQVNLIPIRFV